MEESYSTRLARYLEYEHFYRNDIYGEIETVLQGKVRKIARNAYVSQKHLYVLITSIYNPVKRLVDFYSGHIMAGKLPDALPLVNVDGKEDVKEEVAKVIRQIWKWSAWQRKKTLYTYYGALYGDVAMYVRASDEKVRIDVLHPKDVSQANYEGDELTFVKLEWPIYTFDEKGSREYHTYTEIITPEHFATFKDEMPFHYEGNPGETWANTYGIMPVVLVQHQDMGEEWGSNCFDVSIDKINRLNNVGSYIHTLVYKHAEPVYVSFGTTKGNFIKGDRIWHHPSEKGDVKALVPDVDFKQLQAIIEGLIQELEKDFPELTWHILRTKSEISGKAVKYLLGDVITKVNTARQNYDEALVDAQEIAIKMGNMHNLWNIAEDDIEHGIDDRPVLGETDDVQELLEKELLTEAKMAGTTPKQISKSNVKTEV